MNLKLLSILAMGRFFVWISLELILIGGSFTASPSAREIPLASQKRSSDAKGPESAKLADASWDKYEKKATKLGKKWVWKGNDRPEGGPTSRGAGLLDPKAHGIISGFEDKGREATHGDGHRELGDLTLRGEGRRMHTEFSAEDSKKFSRLLWTESKSMGANETLREKRDDLYARVHDPAKGDGQNEKKIKREGRGGVQLGSRRRRRSLKKTSDEGSQAKSRRRGRRMRRRRRRGRRNRSKGRRWRLKRLSDEDDLNADEDDLNKFFEDFNNKRQDRAAARPIAADPEMVPPHDVIPLDGPTASQPPESDQYPTASQASSDEGAISEESNSPYGNMNMSYVPIDVADFASKIQNPSVVRQFYHEYSLLANFPRETISWDEPDLTYECWVQAMLVGRFPYAPSCETDGTYTRKQCYLQRCWCVRPDGQPVVKDIGERFYYKMAAVNLKCLPPTKRTTPKGASSTPFEPSATFFNFNQTNVLVNAANQTEINGTDRPDTTIADNQMQTIPSADNQTESPTGTDNLSETTAANTDNASRTVEPRPIIINSSYEEVTASSENHYNITDANTDNPSSPVEPNPAYDNPLRSNSSTDNQYETIAGIDNQSESTVANTDNPTVAIKPKPSYDNRPSLNNTQSITDNASLPIEPNPVIDNPPLPIEPNPIIDNPPLLIESVRKR